MAGRGGGALGRWRRLRCPAGLALAVTLALGCRPSAPVEPAGALPPSSVAASGAATDAAATDAAATGTAAPDATDASADASAADIEATPPAAILPDTCTIELEALAPTGAKGHASSDASLDVAKEAAWAEACAQLRKSTGLDCKDPERVGVLTQGSSATFGMIAGRGKHSHFEFDVELGSRRTARGFGDAPDNRPEACRRAIDHACMQLVGGPCPETGMRLRVIAVDGKPPDAAAVEPAPLFPKARDTI